MFFEISKSSKAQIIFLSKSFHTTNMEGDKKKTMQEPVRTLENMFLDKLLPIRAPTPSEHIRVSWKQPSEVEMFEEQSGSLQVYTGEEDSKKPKK